MFRAPQRTDNQGQSIVETAVLVFVIGLSLAVFLSFIRNAMSDRIKVGSDTFGHGMLYRP